MKKNNCLSLNNLLQFCRIKNYVGDGDSSAFSEIEKCMADSFGAGFTVTKFEDKIMPGNAVLTTHPVGKLINLGTVSLLKTP